jgi:tetratricopeptide (TPR) repeat protein
MKRVTLALVSLFFAAIAPRALLAQSVDEGIALFKAGKAAEARAVFAPLAERDPVAAFYLGQIEMGDNADDKAADWFEKAVKMSPRNSVYYDWLGRAYGRQAQHASKFRLPFLARKTKNAWDTSLALDPNNLDVRDDLITYYTRAPGFLGGSKDKAREMASEIKKRNAYRGSFAVVNLCAADEDTACVERELKGLTSSYPDSAPAFATLAAHYANQKDFDKAFAVLDERLRANSNELTSLFAYGRTAALSGQNLDRGAEALRKYLSAPTPERGATPASAHFRLGMIYEKKGAKDQARREYQTALQLNPKLEDAKKALSALGN